MKANRGRMLRGVLCLYLATCFSCNQSLDAEAYKTWVEDYNNGLHISRTLGDFVFDVQYKPASYISLQEREFSNAGDEVSNAENDMQYFTLRIGLKDKQKDFMDYNVQSEQQKSEMLYYYSYSFQNDIYLEDNGQTLPCVLYHFERSYDLKTSRTFVLGFENPDKGSGTTKLVIDSPRLNTGPVKFAIDKRDIPELKRPVNAS